jgi:hypothetical protein
MRSNKYPSRLLRGKNSFRLTKVRTGGALVRGGYVIDQKLINNIRKLKVPRTTRFII